MNKVKFLENLKRTPIWNKQKYGKIKVNIVKLADKYLKMLTSSVTLNFLKSYYKDIKSICKENPELFS